VPSQTFSVLPSRSGKSCSWLLLEEEHGYPLRQRVPAITLKRRSVCFLLASLSPVTDIGLRNAPEGSRPDGCPCVIQLSRNHMDNESAGTSLACRVTDFNVLPLGALISSCRQSVAPVILNSPVVSSQLYKRGGIIVHNKRLVGFVS
jgi:hypothetical protein